MKQSRTIKVTKQGFTDIKQEYNNLKEARKTAVQELSFARSMGDLSENAAYTAARRKLSSVDSRLRYLTHVIRNAVVTEPSHIDQVDIGSIVVVHDGTQERTFSIVGGHESDLFKGRISCYSPLGRSLMGKKVTDAVTIQVPARTVTYTIRSISI